MKNNLVTEVLLVFILLLALVLRVYKLDSAPPSISWDEASVGINGYYIANFGKDEYGKFFPLYFRSFGDDKHPVHVYATSLSVKILGLSEFSTRLPAAIFGVANVFLIFFVGKVLLQSARVGLIASFFLAISPYNIHFSRFNHEANFALFFFMLGLLLFSLSLNKNKNLLPLSFLSFGISFISYHPSKIIVPAILILLVVLYGKTLFKMKMSIILSVATGLIFFLLLFFNPQLLGLSRVNQTSFNKESIVKLKIFQITQNELLGRIGLSTMQYAWHFSPKFLFISGDQNPRLSSQSTGEFYKIDAIFFAVGLLYLILKLTRTRTIILVWLLLAPVPAALVAEAPHAARAMFMMGSWHLISAVGLYYILKIFHKPMIRWGVVISVVSILTISLANYLSYYYGEYIRRYAIEWQYGMKQIVEFVKENPKYNQVYMTDARSEPYVFFLYYLKPALPEYLNTVLLNNGENKSYNTVAFFDRYYFGGWDPLESDPEKDRLYILTPSQYDGLKYKGFFDVKKVIYYPNGATAFFLVSANL